MNILFIEDDPMNRRVVRDMLDVAGARMVEAERAEEGLRCIDEEAFDAVLVDLRRREPVRQLRALFELDDAVIDELLEIRPDDAEWHLLYP